jgi:hypothetical protein
MEVLIMLRFNRVTLLTFAVALSLCAVEASAQIAGGTTATVTTNAPIYIGPAVSPTPLRVAAPGTVLRVKGQEGEWLQVQFQDPQWGERTGWVRSEFVTIRRPELEPMDLSINPQPPAPKSATQAPVNEQPSEVVTRPKHAREGFWFNIGLGYGSLGCDYCVVRLNGVSGGLSLGGTINPHVLLGVGTTGWARSDSDITVSTLDARLRIYPSATSGFFITGGIGLGMVSDFGETYYGVGVVLGLGVDIRVSRNVSLTPFWNGFAMRSSSEDANVGQLGLSVTIH